MAALKRRLARLAQAAADIIPDQARALVAMASRLFPSPMNQTTMAISDHTGPPGFGVFAEWHHLGNCFKTADEDR